MAFFVDVRVQELFCQPFVICSVPMRGAVRAFTMALMHVTRLATAILAKWTALGPSQRFLWQHSHLANMCIEPLLRTVVTVEIVRNT